MDSIPPALKWLICLIVLLNPVVINAMDNLRIAYEWKLLDFNFPNENERTNAIESGLYIPENNLPTGLDVHDNRLFLTIPRWKQGIAASLTYINLTDSNQAAPKLNPYPNWDSHKLDNSTPGIISPHNIRVDRCDRLWVLDSGLNLTSALQPPRLLIFNLQNDELMRSYPLPPAQFFADSLLGNLAIEDADCDDTFAYLADQLAPALVVYSLKSNRSWRVKHHFFSMDPMVGEFGDDAVLQDGVYGLALSKADLYGYATLYFHPLVSTKEFAVDTRTLRNESMAQSGNYELFRVLGDRGANSQSGASFLHQKTGVLFYALLNLNAVACWKTSNPSYTMQSQGRVYMSNTTTVYPSDLKVDANDNLWVLSSRHPRFVNAANWDSNAVNFRILTEKVADAIRGTACDSMLIVPKVVKKMAGSGAAANRHSLRLFALFVAFTISRL